MNGMTTLNHDIAGLHARLNRAIYETYKSASSGVVEYREADVDRILSYLRGIDEFHAWVEDQPELDLPESHPKEYALDANPVTTLVENDAANDIIRLLEVTREELVNSQSARLPAGLISFDSERLTATVEKTRKLVTDFIQNVQPLDLPESTPKRGQSGPGRKGITRN
jgi:hypothetical protein